MLLLLLLAASYALWIRWICRRCRADGARFGRTQSSGGLRALLVTAHPDDECMFFAPTIIELVKSEASVHLLCLSSGNYYGQGPLRQKELVESAAVLGIPASRVTVADREELPDDPRAKWSISLASSLILKHITAQSIDVVLTFDGRGVSGHANHIAVHQALSYLASSGKIPDGCHVLALCSISMFRKYLSVLELPVSWLFPSDFCFVIGMEEHKQAKKAMRCHRSQLLWFRHLYLIFSRYMWVNTFRVVVQEKQVLKFY
ncbi:N-acetylglucosaminyl-phosphatidylinositol de-N-acetylase [Denticeps clupeoides]|uniref:N-acetylglucosaminylphosphatidylinositol deacetylase n=1 Tax=Denticeps clupeoides TaxID=299321 RepID=A0AAY4EQG4_9TELE|nr:N-acetylglucosaminyl-phosphatidylinositol de-N-acetylase [Denticeps clupeoides]